MSKDDAVIKKMQMDWDGTKKGDLTEITAEQKTRAKTIWKKLGLNDET